MTRRPDEGARARRCRGDTGAVATELVLAVPALLLLITVSIHVGMWFHARGVATAAAQEGARGARVLGGTDTDGYTRANQVLDDLGRNLVTDRNVTINRSAGSVTVTVTGHAPQVVPGWTLDINATVTSPLEQFQ